ncbi:MAG: hypothetical protein ACK5BE_00035 [Alphaproteobacteria bacterium]|jgi:hypothetical protein
MQNLFYSKPLDELFQNKKKDITNYINEKISSDKFLNSTDDQLFDHIFSHYKINPLEINEKGITRDDPEETQIDGVRVDYGMFNKVRYTKIRFHIPYEGDNKLWELKPSNYSTTFPRGEVRKDEIIIEILLPNSTSSKEQFKNELDNNINSIRSHIEKQNTDITDFNNSLRNLINSEIFERRERLKKHSDLVSSFNIPLHKKEGAPDITIKKRVIPQLSEVSKDKFKPEPVITKDNYEQILHYIRHMCRTWEQSPRPYHKLNEEDMRDILLSALNGHFEGGASAEAFRRSGKTDIKIEQEDRSAFVAECKMWAGEKSLNDALKQLLRYLTWRDCKTSLIMFNKNTSVFSEIQKKLEESLDRSPNFERKEKINQTGEWRYIFKSSDDENRTVMVHVFLFNLYT